MWQKVSKMWQKITKMWQKISKMRQKFTKMWQKVAKMRQKVTKMSPKCHKLIQLVKKVWQNYHLTNEQQRTTTANMTKRFSRSRTLKVNKNQPLLCPFSSCGKLSQSELESSILIAFFQMSQSIYLPGICQKKAAYTLLTFSWTETTTCLPFLNIDLVWLFFIDQTRISYFHLCAYCHVVQKKNDSSLVQNLIFLIFSLLQLRCQKI